MTTSAFRIFARKSNNEVFECFTWTRDEASGIRRAYSDAKAFNVPIVDAWAVPI